MHTHTLPKAMPRPPPGRTEGPTLHSGPTVGYRWCGRPPAQTAQGAVGGLHGVGDPPPKAPRTLLIQYEQPLIAKSTTKYKVMHLGRNA